MRAQGSGWSCLAITATEQLKALSGIACMAADEETALGPFLPNLWLYPASRIQCSGIGRLGWSRCRIAALHTAVPPRGGRWAFSAACIGDGCKSDAHVVQVLSIPRATNL